VKNGGEKQKPGKQKRENWKSEKLNITKKNWKKKT